jgi:hypothetical protein
MTYEMKSLGEVFAAIQRGRGYGSIVMADTERLRNVDLVNQAGKTAWKQRIWPEFTEIARRTYRPPWDATTSYTTDQEVWRLDADGLNGHYYRAIVGSINVDPQDEAAPATWLVDPPDMRLYIQFEQPWESVPIDGVALDCFATWDDPTYVREPAFVQGLWLVQRTVVFPAPSSGLDQGQVLPAGTARGMPARPWLRFRPPWPKVGATLWNVAEEVPTGTLRYRVETGECYIALRPSTGAIPEESGEDWATRGVPDFFARYIELVAIASRQSEDEGKWKTLADAENELASLEDQAITNTGMQPSAGFRGR